MEAAFAKWSETRRLVTHKLSTKLYMKLYRKIYTKQAIHNYLSQISGHAWPSHRKLSLEGSIVSSMYIFCFIVKIVGEAVSIDFFRITMIDDDFNNQIFLSPQKKMNEQINEWIINE